MEMRTAYYPNVPKGKVSKLDYTTHTSNGFMPTYNYVWGFGGESTEGSKQRVHILPVIFYLPIQTLLIKSAWKKSSNF